MISRNKTADALVMNLGWISEPSLAKEIRNIEREEQNEAADELSRLAALWLTTQPVVSAFIHGMVHSRHDVDDLVQHVAVTCARKFRDFDADGGQRAFRSWALTIARFEVLRYYKRQERERIGFSSDVLESIASEFDRRAEAPDDRLMALKLCLEKLGDRSRQFIEMRYFRDMNADQIADRLVLSAGAVRIALYRTRQSLAECIRRSVERLEHGK